jgi:hypothetical protein
MEVSDLAVTTLRALLANNIDQYTQLLKQMSTDADKRGYAVLLAVAFFEAADQRFGESASRNDVIDFVADVRSRTEPLRDEIDPRTAERVMLAVLDDMNLDDLAPADIRKHQTLLLAGLVADERFSATELDEFLIKARGLAEGTISP